MKKTIGMCLLLVVCSVICGGCFQQKRQPVMVYSQPAPQPQIQWTEAKLIEGKSTKTDILTALGGPDSASGSTIAYEYFKRSPLEGAKIHLTQKDGTELLIVVHREGKTSYVIFYLKDNGVLDFLSF